MSRSRRHRQLAVRRQVALQSSEAWLGAGAARSRRDTDNRGAAGTLHAVRRVAHIARATFTDVRSRLIKITVETIRTKLDTAYLDSLTTAERSGRAKPATNDEVNALQEEVESLYSEILPVAQMSIDQQHLEPAIKSVTARSGRNLSRTADALAYVRKTHLSASQSLRLTRCRSTNVWTIF